MNFLKTSEGGGGYFRSKKYVARENYALLLYVAREDYALFRSARTFWITFVSPSVRPQKISGSSVSSINHHRTTANLSDIVWCMSGGVWWCLDFVWWCLVVSDACLVVSGGVDVYRLI